MRSVLCPPVSACGMRMRKSDPAACWRAWQSSEEPDVAFCSAQDLSPARESSVLRDRLAQAGISSN
eukprot:7376949-Prymnesium_polylepis.1